MKAFTCLIALSVVIWAPGVAVADLALPEGTWDFNGTGYLGRLVLKVGDGGKVRGTVYDQPIVGTYHPETGRLDFTRKCVPDDPSTFQDHKGYLFANQEGENTRYTLAGTFVNVRDKAEMGWYAQIITGRTPVSGRDTPGVAPLDAIMLAWLKEIGCTGATLTIGRGDRTFYSRGYGWSDRNHTVPIRPDTPMCTASCDKPMTAAMIRQLARDGKLDLNASVLRLLKISPAGEVVDPRVWDITINHLLAHKAGWQGEPVDRAWQAANGGQFPIEAETLLRYVMVQKLSWTPGEKDQYDSFGYNTMKKIVIRVSGHGYADYLRHQLLRPHGIKELKWVRHGGRREGEPPQLWNGLIMEDPEELRMDVSTPAMCTFMRFFWSDGEPRGRDLRSEMFYGSWDNATTAMLWRGDGINIAYSFNGRGGDSKVQQGFEHDLHEVIGRLSQEKRLPK